MAAPERKPLDARLARWLVRPLRRTWVTPNHLTTLRLLLGLCACACLARGGYGWANAGALCFALSHFLDHADGELARLTGNMSKAGHRYDLASDALVNVLLFASLGLGLRHGGMGAAALPLGLLAGLAVAAVFHMRMVIEDALGRDGARQPNIGVAESEDVLYLLPVVAFFDQLTPFLLAASIGAPLFALWVLRDYLALKRETRR